MSADPARPASAAATETGLAKGATIGRYVVLGLLGRGGMGEVYAAYDPELDRKIAIKLLHARGGASTAEGRTRLLREAQAIARLSHPNVVVVYDVGTFEESVFLTMEFLDGHTLGYWLQAKPRGWREVLDVFQAAGRGLVAAHTAGLVHRDFKPENVMITREGQVRVMDFGLAREERGGDQPVTKLAAPVAAPPADGDVGATMVLPVDTDATPNLDGAPAHATPPEPSGGFLRLKLTRTGAMLGTPAYMAPEQFAGKGGDARADQFAFSVALYEGLYGHRPFLGENVRALMTNVMSGQIVGAPEGAHVPGWIRRILLRGLSVVVDDRYPTMADMLAALDQDPAVRRRRGAAAAVGVAMLAALAFGAHQLSVGQQAMCAGGPARAASAWGPDQRSAVERAFAASGNKRAAPAFAATASRMDAYAGRWAGMYHETCEATQVRGEQSAEVLDLRMECLGERLSSLHALTDVLVTADRGVVDNAISAADALPALDRCADVSMLRAVIRPPDDPSKRAQVARLREDVGKVNALASAGRCDQATKLGKPVLEAARQLGYKPLEAEISYALGRLFDTCLDLKEALPDLEDAVMAAESSRHDEIAIEASVLLGSAFADLAHDVRLGRQWVRLGESILARFPGHPLLGALVVASRGNVRVRAGQFEEALHDEQRALEIQQFVLGPSSIEVAMSSNNIAMVLHELGRDEEAEQSIRRAAGILGGVLGEESGLVAIASLNECEILTSLGRFEAANAALKKALRIWKQQDASTFYIGAGLLDQGRLELAQLNPRAAVTSLEQALQRLGTQDPHLTAEARFALAQALMVSSPRERERALELARTARAAMEADPSAVGLVRKIDAWQAAHATL